MIKPFCHQLLDVHLVHVQRRQRLPGERLYGGVKALITGGDSGMGRTAAIAYAREGADVAINYLPDEEPDAKEVIALIEKEGRKGVALPGDLRDQAFCEKLVEDAAKALGGLDILVNNAGRQQQAQAIEDITYEAFDATMKTNIYATFLVTKAALKHLKPVSVIIQTTSVQAYDPSEDLVDYAMTKAAVMNFTKSMAKQLGPKGIRVNGVAPVLSGHRCRSAAARQWKSSRNSAATRRWAVRDSRRNWPPSTCNLQIRRPAIRLDRSTARQVAAASPEQLLTKEN